MKKHTWDSRMSIIKPWADTLASSHNEHADAISLGIMLGDNCNDDKLRSTYWTAIRSIGSSVEGFPNEFKPKPRKSRGPTAGTVLRAEFREKLYNVSSSAKNKGSVIYNGGVPSLENLSVNARICDNELGLEKERKIRLICAEYNLKDKNVHIHFRDCSPSRKIGRYERTGRSGAYQGGNRWEPGN